MFYFATGVLANATPNFYTLDDTGLWSAVAVAAPPGPVSGHWPDEAWSLERAYNRDRAEPGDRFRLHRLRGRKRWVPQHILSSQWTDDRELGAMRKSWKIGYLVVVHGDGSVDFDDHDGEVDSLIRINGNSAEDPKFPDVRGALVDIVESKGGDLYTLSRGDGYHVQTVCPDDACAATDAARLATSDRSLPPGPWEWVHTIPRQKHGVSITLATRGPASPDSGPAPDLTHHILHNEAGAWQLDAFAADVEFRGIWPTADGGMWAQTQDALYHRDPAGVWRSVAVPAGVQPGGPVFAAMTADMAELVVLGVRDGAQVVLATAARAQSSG